MWNIYLTDWVQSKNFDLYLKLSFHLFEGDRQSTFVIFSFSFLLVVKSFCAPAAFMAGKVTCVPEIPPQSTYIIMRCLWCFRHIFLTSATVWPHAAWSQGDIRVVMWFSCGCALNSGVSEMCKRWSDELISEFNYMKSVPDTVFSVAAPQGVLEQSKLFMVVNILPSLHSSFPAGAQYVLKKPFMCYITISVMGFFCSDKIRTEHLQWMKSSRTQHG